MVRMRITGDCTIQSTEMSMIAPATRTGARSPSQVASNPPKIAPTGMIPEMATFKVDITWARIRSGVMVCLSDPATTV